MFGQQLGRRASYDLSKGASRLAGDVLGSVLSQFIGDLGMKKVMEDKAGKAGDFIRQGAEKAATGMGASEKAAARVGKFAPLGVALTTAAAPIVFTKLSQGGPSSAAEEIAVRQAGAMGAIDQKLQADLVRQEGYMRMNEQKFQQQLMLQQARADAMTPRNQPMSGAGLFDPMAVGQQIYGSIPQY